MSLSATDMASALHDWTMQFFAVQKFGKMGLDSNSKKVAFSQHDILILAKGDRFQFVKAFRVRSEQGETLIMLQTSAVTLGTVICGQLLIQKHSHLG